MTRKIFLGVIAALIIVISVMSIKKPATQTVAPETVTQSGPSSATTQEQVAGLQTTSSSKLTVDEVAKHNSANSCYTIVNGNVYDVTNWISKHPGGKGAIKAMCGIDASDMFNNQHGGQGGPERILASYKLGTLN